MEPFHVKEALSLLDRVHLFTIQNEGHGSLQYAIEGIINMVEGITIHSKKETFIVKCFYSMFMLYWSSRLFCQKMSVLTEQKKRWKA